MKVPPVASEGTIEYGLPATEAVAGVPALTSVALPMVSAFNNPLDVNSVPVNGKAVP